MIGRRRAGQGDAEHEAGQPEKQVRKAGIGAAREDE
jgi:hypothetical protein